VPDIRTGHFLPFLLGWLVVMLCFTAGLAQVRTPNLKLLLTRTQGIVGCASLLLGAWWLSGTTKGLMFAIVGCIAVVSLNFFTGHVIQ
jgi:hypothetical protein